MTTMMIPLTKIIFILSSLLAGSCHGFVTTNTNNPIYSSTTTNIVLASSNDDSPLDGITEGIQKRFKIAQESNARGADIKQTLAEVIAGEYDGDAARKTIDEAIKSAPCVMFEWANSPSCKQAKDALNVAGVKEFKTVPLDDPWDEGNKLRAELGKMLGRSSVPAIFIGGEYVGGYDGGTSEDKSPGIVKLAFRGDLQEKLKEAGALGTTTSSNLTEDSST